MTTTDTRDELMRIADDWLSCPAKSAVTMEQQLNTLLSEGLVLARFCKSALAAPPVAKFEEIRKRHERDATLRDIDHATSEWRIHRDRATLLRIIDSRTLQADHIRDPSNMVGHDVTRCDGGEPTPTQGLTTRETLAMKMVNPWVLQTMETCRAQADWSHYLDVADAIIAAFPSLAARGDT